MKNQYYGDINDYLKYGILRILEKNGFKICVSWMLTANDNRKDGGKIQYLKQEGKWKGCRSHDPELFDSLKTSVGAGKRNVREAEAGRIIPSAVYHSDNPDDFTDNLHTRQIYFANLHNKANSSNLIFFDPDNGMKVKSVKKGNRNSCKYLYWDEAREFGGERSILVIQFFPRRNRHEFIQEKKAEFSEIDGITCVEALRTAHACFFFAVHQMHEGMMKDACQEIDITWNPHVQRA